MKRSYYLYCRSATVAFVIATLYPLTVNVVRHQLANDWLHSLLHLMAAVAGAYAGWQATDVIPAKVFTWGIGVLHLGLGVYGWFAPGLFLGSHLAIPLDVGDNIFHLLLSAPALSIVAFDVLSSQRPSACRHADE